MRLTGFQLKMLAMILMVCDHVYQYIPNSPIWLTYVGRIVAPIFLYFVVEGFFYTRSRKKYIARMFMWAVIMKTGSILIMLLVPPKGEGIQNNIFLYFVFAFILLITLEQFMKKKTIMHFIYVVLGTAIALLPEMSIFGAMSVYAFYFFRHDKLKLSIAYVVSSIVATIAMGWIAEGGAIFTIHALLDNYQWMMIFALPFLLLYNGERGYNKTWAKYMFYVFYPVHIWMLYIIGQFV
ncbi:TraX family protein [Bacillus luti]|uniref:Conjugal transfer protein TraX n=1 Tax=Bacillus luti TaxID=2026191 RepID=A0A7V7V5A9_9BACI|nr:TraX family protein [Bacillus luti]KAB2442221.1 conjugal transfer protein TraX [Bacillus luti]